LASVIDQRYEELGGPTGFLGAPISVEQPAARAPGRVRIYEHGAIYHTVADLKAGFGLSTQTYEVHGPIWDRFQAIGADGVFGLPQTDQLPCIDGTGAFNHFERCSIFWHPTTGAHEVYGWIRDKWRDFGWERGPLGYPTTGETSCIDGRGRFNHFQYGAIFSHPDVGAHEVQGEIGAKWSELASERGVLGYPTTDESHCIDGRGRFNHFEHGSIFWHPNTHAHEVHGAIRDRWAALEWERGYLGYPVSGEEMWIDEATNTSGREQRFQRGWLQSTPGGIVELKDTLSFSDPVTTPPGTQLGGDVELELHSDGSYRFHGHMHGSGPDPYNFRVRALVRTPNEITVALQHSGHVDGSLSNILVRPHRDNDWDEADSRPEIRLSWDQLKAGATFSVDKEYEDVGLFGKLDDLLVDFAAYVLGAGVVGTPLAFVIVAGKELLDATGGSVGVGGLPGIITAGGIAWAVGPASFVPALVAGVAVGAVTDELVKHRPLHQSERDFANNAVFRGTLPDRIFITNLIHYDLDPTRYFTTPNIDGAVLVHLGDRYTDGDLSTTVVMPGYAVPGQVLIHELTHAWQINQMGIPNVICEAAGGTHTYNPPPAGDDWNSFGLEQQAATVDRWFAGSLDTTNAKDEKSSYFPYIRDNIRLGRT